MPRSHLNVNVSGINATQCDFREKQEWDLDPVTATIRPRTLLEKKCNLEPFLSRI